MNSPDAARDHYAAGNLQTASASKIVTMCFDRLDRDLATARAAIDDHDHFECNDALGHAQDLVAEMVSMLDLDAWEHSGSLVALYDYLLRLLAVANMAKDTGLVAEAQRIVGELGAAFRFAAEQPAGPGADANVATGAGGAADDPASGDVRPVESPADPGDRPRLSIQA